MRFGDAVAGHEWRHRLAVTAAASGDVEPPGLADRQSAATATPASMRSSACAIGVVIGGQNDGRTGRAARRRGGSAAARHLPSSRRADRCCGTPPAARSSRSPPRPTWRAACRSGCRVISGIQLSAKRPEQTAPVMTVRLLAAVDRHFRQQRQAHARPRHRSAHSRGSRPASHSRR